MELERKTVVEVVVSVVAVVVFVVVIGAIGVAYGGQTFQSEGGVALVGAILLFVLGMAGVGLFLAYRQP